MFSASVRKILVYLVLMAFLVAGVSAEEASATPARLIIPDGTPVVLRLAENVSSAHARVGDELDFVVVRDVNLEASSSFQPEPWLGARSPK